MQCLCLCSRCERKGALGCLRGGGFTYEKRECSACACALGVREKGALGCLRGGGFTYEKRGCSACACALGVREKGHLDA